MPRKTLARRKPIPNVLTECCTMAQHDAPSRPPPVETLILPPIPSNPCSNKQIALGRKLTFEFLRQEGFSMDDKLRNMPFETLCNLDVPIYPNLVKELYGTLARSFDGFASTVKEITMNNTHILLGRILHLATEGVENIVHSEREITLRLILGREDVGPLDVVSINQLSPKMRLLHSIIIHILFPKIGLFDFISERDLIIMHCILEEYPLNLSKLIISHMIGGSTKTNACLPYDMVLTLLFQEFKVPILEEEPKRLLHHTDVYSTQSLIRMGFQKNQ